MLRPESIFRKKWVQVAQLVMIASPSRVSERMPEAISRSRAVSLMPSSVLPTV